MKPHDLSMNKLAADLLARDVRPMEAGTSARRQRNMAEKPLRD